MIGLEMKNINMILIEKLQRYWHYEEVKLININILPSGPSQTTQQATCPDCPQEKFLERRMN